MKTAREIRHAIEYAAVRGALFMAGAFPLRLGRAIGACAGWLAFALRIRRDVSVDNIQQALGVSRGEATRIARRSYQNLGRGLIEVQRLFQATAPSPTARFGSAAAGT